MREREEEIGRKREQEKRRASESKRDGKREREIGIDRASVREKKRE